jgi:hypothetical protein
MAAVRRHTATRLGAATGLAIEKPMPRGLTFHAPHILYHGHYDVPPGSPWELGTPHHLNYNCQKEKMAACFFLPFQFNF